MGRKLKSMPFSKCCFTKNAHPSEKKSLIPFRLHVIRSRVIQVIKQTHSGCTSQVLLLLGFFLVTYKCMSVSW